MQKKFLLTPEERVRVCKYCSKSLRNMRKSIGLNQAELASALGTNQRHISEIENGKATLSWTFMLAFSTFLMQFPQMWQKNMADTSDCEPSETTDGVRELERLMTGLKANS